MYRSFGIENFRCIKGLTIEPLARVNLIAGKNDMGKTALLEALWLHSGPNMPELGDRLARFRGIPGQDPARLMHDLFHNYNSESAIELSAKGSGAVSQGTLKVMSRPRDNAVVTAAPNPHAPSMPPRGSQELDASAVSDTEIVFDYTDGEGRNYVSSAWWARSDRQSVEAASPGFSMTLVAEGLAGHRAGMPSRPTSVFLGARQRMGTDEDLNRFGRAEIEGHADRIVAVLKQVDGRVERLLTVAAPPAPMTYADIGLGRPVPVGLLGDGVGRLLSMACAFLEARDGIVLIDEVENGLHHSVLQSVWEHLDLLSQEFNLQVFATTHSYECMVAARDAFARGSDKEFCIHRLELQDEGIVATTYPFEALDFTLDYGAEIR